MIKAAQLKKKYGALKKKNVASALRKVIGRVSGKNRLLRSDLERAGRFALRKFKGKFRQDKKTPLLLHSIFLLEILRLFGEKDPATFIAALLHDTIEDTGTKRQEIRSMRFESTKKKILPLVLKLTQDRKVSDELPKKGAISPRIRKFIKNLTGAPKEVINIELADRIHDFLDIGYLKTLEPEKARLRLANKIKRNKTIVATITRRRGDINRSLLRFFKLIEREIKSELKRL
ncbi:MAG: HD domain-containing protein [Candidatus Liptonbacteria bacterium]|nr:HD domain-containing protein [Candidatus Liptonbacteria bacterium]